MKKYFLELQNSIAIAQIVEEDFCKKFGISAVINAEGKNLQQLIGSVDTLQGSGAGQACFFANSAYKKYLSETQASICFLPQEYAQFLSSNCIGLICKNAYFSFSKFVNYLYGGDEVYKKHELIGEQNYTKNSNGAFIHKMAIVDESAHIAEGSVVHAFTTISKNVKIGVNCVIMQNCFIGEAVEIGEGGYIYNGVSIMYSKIGANCIIRSSTTIGGLGFGFAADPVMGVSKNQHIAGVVIGNNVDIGSNTTIDRGYLSDTKIGDFTKIDNLVMIAHGVEIGAYCFLAGQTGIAGSTKLLNQVICGAQSGIAGHLTIASGVTLSGKSGVISSIEEKGIYAGFPTVGLWLWRRMHVTLQKLTKGK